MPTADAPINPAAWVAQAEADAASPPTPAAPALAIGPGGLVGGLVAGLIAAVLATIAWYLIVALSGYQIGFVAVAVGWLVGTAVVLGARGRVSWALVGASVVLTLAALFVSEYLIVYHIFTELGRDEFGFAEAIPLLQPPDVMFDFVRASIEADPMTLLFWGFALLAAAYIPFRALRPSS